jgi:hypothetical protein
MRAKFFIYMEFNQIINFVLESKQTASLISINSFFKKKEKIDAVIYSPQFPSLVIELSYHS